MKKCLKMMMACLCALSLAACSSKPSLEDVEKAIADGSLTVEDAFDKGYVTQEWVDEYNAEHTVDAVSKIDAFHVEDFETVALNGETFTSDMIASTTFFAFIDSSSEESNDFYQELVNAYDEVVSNGADILLCVKGENSLDAYVEAPFTVIRYDDAVKTAVQKNGEMIEGIANTASWFVNGSFLSAWYGKVNAEELGESAKGFVKMQQDMSEKADTESSDGAAMGILG